MKKMMLTAAGMLLFGSTMYAQRTCGTMDNLEYRMKVDPTLAGRMAADEQRIQEWISTHAASTVTFPKLENFTPTGNEAADRAAYAAAKQAWIQAHGAESLTPATDPRKVEALRAQKKKTNSFTTK